MTDANDDRTPSALGPVFAIAGVIGLIIGGAAFTGSTSREWWGIAILLNIVSVTSLCGGVGAIFHCPVIGSLIGLALALLFWANAIFFVGMC